MKRSSSALPPSHSAPLSTTTLPRKSSSYSSFSRQDTKKPTSTSISNSLINNNDEEQQQEQEDENFFKNLENQSFGDLATVKKQIELASKRKEERLAQDQAKFEKEQETERISKMKKSASFHSTDTLSSRATSVNSTTSSSKKLSRRGSLLANTVVDAESINYQQRKQKKNTKNSDAAVDEEIVVVVDEDDEDNKEQHPFQPHRPAPQIPSSDHAGSASALTELDLLKLKYKKLMFDLRSATSRTSGNEATSKQQQVSYDRTVFEALSTIDCILREVSKNTSRTDDVETLNSEELLSKPRNEAFERELGQMMMKTGNTSSRRY